MTHRDVFNAVYVRGKNALKEISNQCNVILQMCVQKVHAGPVGLW